MRVERELMRGAGPVAVLRLLQRTGEMYGYELVEALDRHSGGVLAMGQSTLYPLLYNLEAKGLVKSHWKTAGGGGGRDRKYYALTDRGRKRLAIEMSQWQALTQAMTELGVITPGAAATTPATRLASALFGELA